MTEKEAWSWLEHQATVRRIFWLRAWQAAPDTSDEAYKEMTTAMFHTDSPDITEFHFRMEGLIAEYLDW